LLVAPIEEVLFRGFLMSELTNVLGTSTLALTVNLLLSSALFGLAHLYQGNSGVISTAVVGMVIGLIFIGTGFYIWPAIITHATIDTVSLLILFANKDRLLKNLLIKSNDVQDDEEEGNKYSSDTTV
jgi:membrane protease YdiL (CAAX protease family)